VEMGTVGELVKRYPSFTEVIQSFTELTWT
jgi:hypothetical protein